MSALAAQHKAVNLGQGFPDFPMNADLIDLVAKAMRENHNQYAPMPGWMPLREAIAEKIKAKTNESFFYGWGITRKYSKSEIANALLFNLNISNIFEPTGTFLAINRYACRIYFFG